MIFWSGPQLIPVKTDSAGNIVMNIIPRTGLKANLLTLAGQNGELASPTDLPALIRLTGVAGKAKMITPYQNVFVRDYVIGSNETLAPHFAKLVTTGIGVATVSFSAGIDDGQEVVIEAKNSAFFPAEFYAEDGSSFLGVSDFAGKIVIVRWDAGLVKWIRCAAISKSAAAFLLATGGPTDGFTAGPGSSAAGKSALVIGRGNSESVAAANPGAVIVGNHNTVAADGALIIGNKVDLLSIATDSIVINNNTDAASNSYDQEGVVAFGVNPKTARTRAWGNNSQNLFHAETLLHVTTSNASATAITTDGAVADFVNFTNIIVPISMFQLAIGVQTGDTTIIFTARISGHVSGSNDFADFEVKGTVFWNNAAGSLVIGHAAVTPLARSAALNTSNVAIDVSSLLGMVFNVTGVATKTIKWFGKIDMAIMINA